MAKARDAFRTISEVSEWLDTPAHVLRFWESKFSQIKPVKRAGGRRYYRPDDMRLLAGIKLLLHEQGMTIKGAQKLLREKGIKHVQAMSPPLDGDAPAPSKSPDIKAVEPKAEVVDAIEEAEVVEEMTTEAPTETPAAAVPAMPPPMRPKAAITGVRRVPDPVDSPPVDAVAESPTEPAPQEAAAPASAPAAEPAPTLETKPTLPPRVVHPILALVRDSDADVINGKSNEIQPLLTRLATLRDRMRAG